MLPRARATSIEGEGKEKAGRPSISVFGENVDSDFLCFLHRELDGVRIVVHGDLGELTGFQHQTPNKNSLLLIMVSSDADLEKLVDHAERLLDFRIIMMVHKDDMETLKRAHALRPRVLFQLPVDFRDVAAVVKKMFDVGGVKQ